MLKQISTVMAILFAAIIVTTLPAMSETDKPDATTEEQQVKEEKKPEPKEIGKKGSTIALLAWRHSTQKPKKSRSGG